MMRVVLFTCLLLSCLSLYTAVAQAATHSDNGESIKAQLETFQMAMNNMDTKMLGELCSSNMTFEAPLGSPNNTLYGVTAFQNALASFWGKLDWILETVKLDYLVNGNVGAYVKELTFSPSSNPGCMVNATVMNWLVFDDMSDGSTPLITSYTGIYNLTNLNSCGDVFNN